MLLLAVVAATSSHSGAWAFVNGPAPRIIQGGQGAQEEPPTRARRAATAPAPFWGSGRLSLSPAAGGGGGVSRPAREIALYAALGGAGGGSLTPDGRTNQNYRTLSPEDFAANRHEVDKSKNPEKRAEIAAALPGVNLDKLCKEVPDVLLWPPAELAARMAVLAEAMPGEDLVKAVSQAPTILIGTPYLKKTLEQFAKWFPGKTLSELLPRYTDSTLGTAPRSFEYPKRLEWEVPYLDPGLMGNYTVKTELVEAMKRSQHLVFGMWKEDEEALANFVKAMRRAVLAFETRVFFLRDHYPREHFERYYADDLFGETVGFVEDWSKKHPGFDAWMDEKLAGYQNMETFRLKRLPVGEKEELLIQARAEGVLGPDGAYMGRALPGSSGAEEEDDEDDGWEDLEDEAASLEGGAEEDGDDEFVQAMQQALWVFEVRAGFLERLVGTEAYRNEMIRRVRKETAGSAEEFLARFPQYAEHLHEVLDGWGEISSQEWEKIHVDDKEDQLVEMLKVRGRAMVSVQTKMAAFRPPLIPPTLTERAVESREEARAKLAAEEEAALEKLSDAEMKKHWEAYEAYVLKRFPQVAKDVEAARSMPGRRSSFVEDEDEEEEEDAAGGFV